MVKKSPANAGDAREGSLIPEWGRSPGEGDGNPLQYSYLGNPMDRGAWKATVQGVAKSWTWLCALTHTSYGRLLGKAWQQGKVCSADLSGCGKEPANAGDVRDRDSIPGPGRSPEGGHGNPLQCSPGEFHGHRSL